MPITARVEYNRLPRVRRSFPGAVNTIVHEQVLQTQTDVRTNILKYDYIDTGETFRSVEGDMTGEFSGEVTVGTDYAVFGNYGTRYQPARPFFSDAVVKAEAEYPDRFKKLESQL